jgi:cyclopropane fatty-acyl-phospholipid synthase-like methyltransferase
MSEHSLKSMKLYYEVERVFLELRALGIGEDQPISVEVLSTLDQYHYLGTQAVDEAIRLLSLRPGQRVLDVGSGIGGPARYIAHQAECRVTALEIQPDLHITAAALTERCGLEARIEHVCGDILEWDAETDKFDALVSWLVFLHIPDRETLLSRSFESLKPGGQLFAEDFYARGSLTAVECDTLASKVYCSGLPSRFEYAAQLERAGFIDVEFADMTKIWTRFVRERSNSYQRDRTRHVDVSGARIFDGLDDFYRSMALLFEGGNLGGVRLTARRP